jgi:hypothetical protein
VELAITPQVFKSDRITITQFKRNATGLKQDAKSVKNGG